MKKVNNKVKKILNIKNKESWEICFQNLIIRLPLPNVYNSYRTPFAIISVSQS